MSYRIAVANQGGNFASFDITDPKEMSLCHKTTTYGPNSAAAIAYFRDLVMKRYGEKWESFDLTIDGRHQVTVRRIPLR